MSSLLNCGRLITADSEAAVAFEGQIRKLRAASEPYATFSRGVLRVLTGNIDEAVAALTDAALAQSDGEVFCAYSNLGYATLGLEQYRKVGSPVTGSFTQFLAGGLSVGAIRTIGHFLSQAETMHLSNMEGVPVELLKTAEKILQDANAEDAAIARVLDIAGAVVREYGLVHLGQVMLDASTIANSVKLRYRFAIAPDQALWLYNEFLDRLYDEDVPVPPAFLVAFEGQGGQDNGNDMLKSEKNSEIRI